MQKLIEKDILEAILEVSKGFLKDDICVEVISTCRADDIEVMSNFATVTYRGDIDLLFVLGIDDLLLQSIYDFFIPVSVAKEEKKELLEELPNEVINTIAGLVISKFPKPYDTLELSPPLCMKKEEIMVLKETNFNVAKTIKTKKGNFCCTIIKI